MAYPTIACVIVTYNRCELLVSCLKRILEQTIPVSVIFLIDNASSDGTEKRLKDEGFIAHPRIRYIRQAENIGGAGGFRRGMELALETDCDWVWLLDDDVKPQQSCLDKLLQYSNISKCIHPIVVYDDGSTHEWEHLFEPSTTYQIGLGNISFRNGKDWCAMQVGCFEGMLIGTDVVQKIGLPLAEFFVFGDDGHYGFLANQHTNVIYVKNAILEKAQKPPASYTPFKIYYDIRNRFLLRKLLKKVRHSRSFERRMFYLFMFSYTQELISPPNRGKKIIAAFYGWLDGIRHISGRARY